MGILITLLIAVIFIAIAFWLVNSIGLDPRTAVIVRAVLALIFLLWLFQEFAHPFGGFYLR